MMVFKFQWRILRPLKDSADGNSDLIKSNRISTTKHALISCVRDNMFDVSIFCCVLRLWNRELVMEASTLFRAFKPFNFKLTKSIPTRCSSISSVPRVHAGESCQIINKKNEFENVYGARSTECAAAVARIRPRRPLTAGSYHYVPLFLSPL